MDSELFQKEIKKYRIVRNDNHCKIIWKKKNNNKQIVAGNSTEVNDNKKVILQPSIPNESEETSVIDFWSSMDNLIDSKTNISVLQKSTLLSVLRNCYAESIEDLSLSDLEDIAESLDHDKK